MPPFVRCLHSRTGSNFQDIAVLWFIWKTLGWWIYSTASVPCVTNLHPVLYSLRYTCIATGPWVDYEYIAVFQASTSLIHTAYNLTNKELLLINW